MAPEKGLMKKSVMMLCSRRLASYFTKIGRNNFSYNTVAATSGGRTNFTSLEMGTGTWGHPITMLKTPWGVVNIMVDEQFRDEHRETSIITTLENVANRPMEGNGRSRDYQVYTNVQENDRDGRRDYMLSECGLQVELPETHCVVNWS